jgi:hypothetical protein
MESLYGRINGPYIVEFLPRPLKSIGYTEIKKVNHGNLRDDRPTHGRVGRAIGIYLLRVDE